MKFLSDILAKAGLTVDGVVTLNNTATGQTPASNDNSTKLATTAWVRTFVQPYSLPIATSSVLGGIKVGTGLSIDAGSGILSVTGGGAASIKSTQTFTATGGQTVFTITGGYIVGLIDIFLNGVYLSPNQTTATNGTSITLGDAALAGDIIDVIIASPVFQGATTTTDQLSEGTTNLYFTNARARAAISETVTGLDYNSSTGVLSITTGYGIPTTASQTNWNAAYNDKINSAAVTGSTTKTLTLTQQDGGTVTATWTDINTDAVTSVFGRTGVVVAVSGDYTTTLVTEGTNLYYTDARARAAISVTGSGSYNSATGVITVTGGVTSVNTLTGAVVLTTTNIAEGTNLYYTQARFDTAFTAKSTTNLTEGTNLYYTSARANADFDTRLATKSTSNLSEGTNLYYTDARVGTYLTANSYATQTYVGTQIANLVAAAPATLDTLNELAAALGNDPSFATTVSTSIGTKVPQARTITINGTTFDLSANRTYTITSMVYPGAGIAVSTGSAWGTSLTDNSSNWNTAFGWGNHAGLYSLLNHTHTFASLTSKPTTLVGYGITDAATSAQGTNADTAYGWGNHASGGYVTLTGTQTISGVKTFSTYQLMDVAILIKHGSNTSTGGYTGIGSVAAGLTINLGIGTTASLLFNTSASYSYTFPAASGTIALTSDLSTYATQTYVGTQIANLVASSPAALDTLNELAAALGNDAAFSTTVSTALGNRLRVDINTQGLSATLQGYGRTNLGLGTAAVSNTGDFAAASHTHSIANVTGLQTALDGKQASGSYAASSHSHIISDVTGLQTALDGKQASLGFTPYNSTNPSGYISSYTETSTLANVTARGASTTTRTTFVEVGVTKDGSDTVATGPWFRWTNAAETRQMLVQLNASNGLTYWSYNGTAWVSAMTLSQTGVLSTTGALSVGNSTEVNGLIQLGANGRYGMGVSGAYTNVYSHDSGLGVRLGSYNGTTFTPVLTAANTGAVTITGNVSAANLSGTNTGDQTTITGNAGSATLLKSINTTTSVLSNWNPQSLTYQAWGQAWAHSSISADTGDMVLWLRAGQYSAGGTEVCMMIDGDYYAGSGAQKVLHAGNYNSYAVPLGGGTMTGQLQINTPSNGVGSAFQLYSTAYHQYLSIYSNGSYEAMVNYRNTTTQWYAGLRTSAQLVGTDGFHFYNTTQAQTVAGFSNTGTIYSIGNINVNGEGNFGPDSGGDNGIRIRYGNGGAGYGRIRFHQDGTNHSTIHSFAATWQGGSFIGASAGAINIDGQYGATFGGWNVPYAHINSDGIYVKSWATPSGAMAWNSSAVLRLQQGSTGDNVFMQFRNRADVGDYSGILFSDNNIGGYLGFRTYASNDVGAGSDCMIYGTYNDHIFQNGSSGTFNGKTETFRIYANGSVRATGDVTAYSDRRVKENIITIDNALEKTLQLRGVFYNRTDKDDKSQKVGVIAQEIQEILPQVVNEDYNGLLSVSYGNITGVLIEAIKEQQTQIESQKSEIDELKDLVQQLINR